MIIGDIVVNIKTGKRMCVDNVNPISKSMLYGTKLDGYKLVRCVWFELSNGVYSQPFKENFDISDLVSEKEYLRLKKVKDRDKIINSILNI